MHKMPVPESGDMGLHLIADGAIEDHLLTRTVHACTRGALCQRCDVLFFLPLTNYLLAAEPLAHGLLVARSDLFVHLEVGGSKVRSSAGGAGNNYRNA